MSYNNLLLDASTPHSVRNLIVETIDKQSFSDIHSMLRLPLLSSGIGAGCNFAITHVLMSVIAGVSTTLYAQHGTSGARFKQLLIKYYPWELDRAGGVPPGKAADIIYHVFRNPLTHNLGLDLDLKRNPNSRKAVIKRLRVGTSEGLAEAIIDEIEVEQKWPKIMSATVSIERERNILLVVVYENRGALKWEELLND